MPSNRSFPLDTRGGSASRRMPGTPFPISRRPAACCITFFKLSYLFEGAFSLAKSTLLPFLGGKLPEKLLLERHAWPDRCETPNLRPERGAKISSIFARPESRFGSCALKRSQCGGQKQRGVVAEPSSPCKISLQKKGAQRIPSGSPFGNLFFGSGVCARFIAIQHRGKQGDPSGKHELPERVDPLAV